MKASWRQERTGQDRTGQDRTWRQIRVSYHCIISLRSQSGHDSMQCLDGHPEALECHWLEDKVPLENVKPGWRDDWLSNRLLPPPRLYPKPPSPSRLMSVPTRISQTNPRVETWGRHIEDTWTQIRSGTFAQGSQCLFVSFSFLMCSRPGHRQAALQTPLSLIDLLRDPLPPIFFNTAKRFEMMLPVIK